jgi:hypothetical protein
VQHLEALRLAPGAADADRSEDLASALDALAACAAVADRAAHAALLAEVFALHAWTVPAVSGRAEANQLTRRCPLCLPVALCGSGAPADLLSASAPAPAPGSAPAPPPVRPAALASARRPTTLHPSKADLGRLRGARRFTSFLIGAPAILRRRRARRCCGCWRGWSRRACW